jgi:hypothetical protein
MFYHPREYHLWSCHWSIQFGSSYPEGMSSLTLELKKVLFHSEHQIELDQEDGVMKRNTSRVMKYNPILQGAMSPTHRRKSCMRDWEVFLIPIIPISSFLRCQCIFHRFLCPFLCKSRDEIFLKGEGCNTPCYGFPNHILMRTSILRLQSFLPLRYLALSHDHEHNN